jgi:tripartite-type tricarboxylate transporter receptor subunit TctC
MKRIVLALLLCGLAQIIVLPQGRAVAQSYPNAPIKVITDSGPGSAPDVNIRIVAAEMSQILGQQLLILNKPGASGSIAASAATASQPDGYTLYAAAASSFISVKDQAPNIPLEMPRDFTPVSLITEHPMFLVVSPQTEIKSVGDLIAMAKAKPGEVSFATTGQGRQSHLTGEMLQRMAGVQLVAVHYTGGPVQAMGDVTTGRVQALIEGGSALIGPMQSGLIRGIAVATKQRLPNFPNLPAISETVPGFASAGWLVLVAPKGTPPAIIETLSKAAKTAMAKPEIGQKLLELGSIPRWLSPDDTLAYVKQEQVTWAPILGGIAAKP